MRDIAEFFYRPDQKKYGVAIYTDNAHDGLAGASRSLLFSYGGELGDYSTYKVDGIINSDKAIAALDAYKELYKFTPPGWANAIFIEDNQAITENLAAMSMNFFAFFPSLINEASNPNAKNTGFFANPAGPNGDQFAALGGQGISIVSYSQKQDEVPEVPRMVHQGRNPEEVGRPRRLHLQRRRAEVGRVPERHAVQQGLLRDHVQGEGLLGGSRECRTAAATQPARLSLRTGDQGTAKETLDALAADWNATFKKYGRQ